jgi:hypothetical protein
MDRVGIEQLDADVDIRVILFDGRRPDQRLGIALRHVFDVLIPQDYCPLAASSVCGDARDEISYVVDGALYILTQDTPYPGG